MKVFTVILTRDVTESAVIVVDAVDIHAAEEAAMMQSDSTTLHWDRDDNVYEPPYVTDVTEGGTSAATCVVAGSEGDIVAAFPSGAILSRTCPSVYPDVAQIDFSQVSAPNDPEPDGRIDILYVGHWLADGTYVVPCDLEMPCADGGQITLTPRDVLGVQPVRAR